MQPAGRAALDTMLTTLHWRRTAPNGAGRFLLELPDRQRDGPSGSADWFESEVAYQVERRHGIEEATEVVRRIRSALLLDDVTPN
jgi:hypothetical protein